MRRNDREITDLREILRLMDRCDVVNLAFADNGEPYVVPVNFGYVSDGETKAVLYFHGAREGRKASLAEKTGVPMPRTMNGFSISSPRASATSATWTPPSTLSRSEQTTSARADAIWTATGCTMIFRKQIRSRPI